jgi:rhamnopyranosyl-N-acetylglucosaminyl-diphospho-decaprenol beta-1,3/1,4-galactofuranosyltransferase
VTRNRLPLLKRCIDVLRTQDHALAAIVVVNNGSSDGTAEWVKNQSDLTLITQANVGSAGGQNAGIRRAFETGLEWIWCMDDDGVPDKHALATLLGDETEGALWRNCLVVDIADPEHLAFSHKTVAEAQAEGPYSDWVDPFNGTLIHRSAIPTIGYPASDLFIKGDEIEYAWRAAGLGVGVKTNTHALFFHPASSTNDVTEVPLSAFWRHYYRVRNKDAKSSNGDSVTLNGSAALQVGLRDARKLVRHAVMTPLRDAIKLWMIARAVIAAWRGDTTRRYLK